MSLKECFMIMYLDCKHKVAGCLINAVEKDSKIQVLLVILVSRLCDLSDPQVNHFSKMVAVTFIYKALFVLKQFHSNKQEK